MAVQYDRAMITLIREIRNQLKGDDKLGIKLANPDLLSEIYHIYHRPNLSVVLKALIQELFNRTGDEWQEPPNKDNHEKRYITKPYRGVQQLVEVPKETNKPLESNKKSSQRIYRGQIVD